MVVNLPTQKASPGVILPPQRDEFRKAVEKEAGMNIIPGQEMSVYTKLIQQGVKPAPMSEIPKQTPGVARTVLQSIRPSLVGAYNNFIKSEKERRATTSISEQAKVELIERPAKILKAIGFDFPRLIAGSISTVGKTVLETVYAPIFGKGLARSPLFGTTEQQKKVETLLYGAEAKSWQEIKEDVDEFTATSPLATPWEKKNLGLTLAVAGFTADSFWGGGKSKLGEKALKELVEATDEFVARETLIKYGVPKDLANVAAFSITKANTPEAVEEALKGASKALLQQTEAAPRVSAQRAGTSGPFDGDTIAPKDYLDRLRSGDETIEQLIKENGVREKIDRYKEMMKAGEMPPPVSMRYLSPEESAQYATKPKIMQDGFHRAAAAYELGIEKIPFKGKPFSSPSIPKDPIEAAEGYTAGVIAKAKQEKRAIVLGADDLKDFYGKDYDTSRHSIYSQATKKLFEQEVPLSANPIVRFTSGPPGAGKTDFALEPAKLGFDGVVYESTFSDLAFVKNRIAVVRAAGKEPEIFAVIPDLEKARYYTMVRGAKTGREIDSEYFVKTALGNIKALKGLIDEGLIDASNLRVIDTRGLNYDDVIKSLSANKYVEDPIDFLRKIDYNEKYVRAATRKGEELYNVQRGKTSNRGGSIPVSSGDRGSAGARNVARGSDEALSPDTKLPTYQQLYELNRRASKGAAPEELDELVTQLGFYEEAIETMPGKKLARYVSRTTGELPQIIGTKTQKSLTGSGKKVQTSEFAQRGDSIIQEALGAEDAPTWEMAQKAVDDYKELRAQLNDLKELIIEKRKDVSALRKVERISDMAMRERRMRLRALQDRYTLTDAEVKSIRGRRDFSAMTESQFNAFLVKAEAMAENMEVRREALVALKGTLYEKELLKTENLRQAMELPPISQMSAEQIRQFDEVLSQYKQGDEFLSVRKLELVDRTDLAGIKTMREARERLLADVNAQREALGQKPYMLDQLATISVKELDRYRYDAALARRNPFYQLMVEEKAKAFLTGNMNFLKIRDDVETLVKAARASRSRGLVERMVPTDKTIFEWLEADDLTKNALAKKMTVEELEAAHYIRNAYADARDYLVQQKVLKQYQRDYITHIRRGFLEAWQEDGLVTAFREVFKQYKLDEAMFNILDQKTGEILPLEKFFRFSMRRSGDLEPSKNVAKAVESYFMTLEKKKALDSLVPKLDIYVHALTPKKLTPRGLEFDDSLKRFLNEWLNTKKGRPVDAIVKPGGKLDWALRTGVAFTRLIDLGFSIPIGVATAFGEQAANFVGLGIKKHALGAIRLSTKQGRAIAHKYEAFTGEPVLKGLLRATQDSGDRIANAAFSLFQIGTRNANEVYLLGSLTKEEFEKGIISPNRLTQIQLKMAKYRVVPDMESIMGKTAVGKVGTQYKTWAVPLLSATVRNIAQFSRAVKNKGFEDAMQKEESVELLREIVLLSTIGFGVYGFMESREDKKVSDMTFTEEIAFKTARDSLSIIGALDPALFTSEPRLMQFIARIGEGVSQIVNFETNKEGELKGVNNLQGAFTPSALRQIMREFEDEEETTKSKKVKTPAGLPELSSAGPGGLPKLPSLPN